MVGSGMNLVTTAIGFGMSATFIVFVCTRLICGRASAANSRASESSASAVFDLELHPADLDPPEHVISGLEPDVVAAFPTKKYNRESSSFHEDAQCSICLGEYQENEVLRIMPTCGHEFHRSCIDLWLEKQSTCPICRLSLDDSCEAKDAASSFHYGRGWALPRAERPRWRDNNQEIHEALRIDLEATAAAQPGSRR